MTPQPISTESRELLNDLRDLLLEQHKLLLDRERASYEKIHGTIAVPLTRARRPVFRLAPADLHARGRD